MRLIWQVHLKKVMLGSRLKGKHPFFFLLSSKCLLLALVNVFQNDRVKLLCEAIGVKYIEELWQKRASLSLEFNLSLKSYYSKAFYVDNKKSYFNLSLYLSKTKLCAGILTDRQFILVSLWWPKFCPNSSYGKHALMWSL